MGGEGGGGGRTLTYFTYFVEGGSAAGNFPGETQLCVSYFEPAVGSLIPRGIANRHPGCLV